MKLDDLTLTELMTLDIIKLSLVEQKQCLAHMESLLQKELSEFPSEQVANLRLNMDSILQKTGSEVENVRKEIRDYLEQTKQQKAA